MRILIVSQYFDPEPVPIPGQLARGLAQRGHSVRVLTGFPNYPRGRIFDGHRQAWLRRERVQGVEVFRVPLIPDHSRSALRRLANYLSFAVTALAARRAARGADVVYVYATQMTPALAPWIWSRLGGAPYVLHIQDLWPDSIIGSGLAPGRLSGLIGRVLDPWLRSVYRGAAALVGIAPTMTRTLGERGARAERTHLVPNWAEAPVPSPPRPAAGEGGVTTVVYAGNIGELQGLQTAVEAAHAAADAGVVLRIVGDGTDRERLRDLVEARGYHNVEFLPAVPQAEMPAVYAAADYALVCLRDLPVFRGTIPSKLQGALAHGVPVIVTVPGDAREIVMQARVGFCAPPEDVEALADAFRRAAAADVAERIAMARRAGRLHAAEFAPDVAIDRLERILEDATR